MFKINHIFSGENIVQRFEMIRFIILSFVLWLQFPLTDGAGLGLNGLKAMIGRYVRVRQVATTERSNFVLRMLVGFRIITDEQRIVFSEVMR